MGTEPQPTNPQNLTRLQLVIGVVAFVLLLVLSICGIFSGIARAKSLDTYNSASKIYQALKYYEADESQYPTLEQFHDQQVLIPNYMDKMLFPTDSQGVCTGQTEFSYQRISPQSFQLQFCLQKNVNGLVAGSHVIGEQGLEK